MTRIICNDLIELETNGDCSSFQLNFPTDFPKNEIEELKQNFLEMGFPVYEPQIPEPNSIVFSVLAMKGTKQC